MKKLALALALALSLGGCATTTSTQGTFRYEKVSAAVAYEVRQLTFKVADADVWFRAPNPAWNHFRFIRTDSPTTSFQAWSRWALYAETGLNRRFVELMPREQGEYYLSSKLTTLLGSGSVLTDSQVETVDWAGRPGFKVTASFTTANGLDMKLVAYGASYDRYLYTMAFEGDVVENFDKTLPLFETVAKSAVIKTAN